MNPIPLAYMACALIWGTTWYAIRVSREGARQLGEIAAELARGEGLSAHALAAEYRMKGP